MQTVKSGARGFRSFESYGRSIFLLWKTGYDAEFTEQGFAIIYEEPLFE